MGEQAQWPSASVSPSPRFCSATSTYYNTTLTCRMKVVRHIEATATETATWTKWLTAAEVGTAVDDCFSPTYHVPSGTSRAKAGSVSSDPFGRKLRHGRSRERKSQRGRHHAKGTRFVGEIGCIAAMLAPLASSRPYEYEAPSRWR